MTIENIEKRLAVSSFSEVTGRTLSGYVVLWGIEANIGGQFTEVFERGAFADSLANRTGLREVLILTDHDPEALLGRVGINATLVDDSRGLKVTVELPDTSVANDVRELASKGLLGGWSIGFAVPPGGDTFDGNNKRTIRKAIAIEASAIRSHAAYEQTKDTVSIRSLHANAERDMRRALYLAVLGGAR
ncbi:HK97 family phage prohead protease [Agrobacterium rhizogenes]|nr:HK97 family phage prohead protease [Rhizobium rhizogenes]NTF75126.1 HK97 family phage prohead protease [Rhizobium rhizogenes]NTH51520.1 HK97 family phage prohead protease [Rhizobium rhizogenes]NTH71104.1 HK97 family phage prohead protease [Rhizobium rhizogenes]